MNNYKFRGTILNEARKGEWVYGYYYSAPNTFNNNSNYRCNDPLFSHSIVDEFGKIYLVDPETVGQWAGLKDKNGVEIYEGDIVMIMECRHFVDNLVFGDFIYLQYHEMGWNSEGVDITGNIHDNPELLSHNT